MNFPEKKFISLVAPVFVVCGVVQGLAVVYLFMFAYWGCKSAKFHSPIRVVGE